MKTYSIIYADPPWWYSAPSQYTKKPHHPEYPLMTEAELIALPIKQLADTDCTLFIWATSYRLPMALRVLDAWGFDYKAIMAWDKVRQLVSQYTRGNMELLLIGGKGKSTPITQKGLPSAIYTETKTGHSVKPEWFATEYIDKFWPNGNRIELFARKARPGWDVWGNEAPGSIDFPTN